MLFRSKAEELGQAQQRIDVESAGKAIESMKYISAQYTPVMQNGQLVYRSKTGGPDLTPNQMQQVYNNAWQSFRTGRPYPLNVPSAPVAPQASEVSRAPRGAPASAAPISQGPTTAAPAAQAGPEQPVAAPHVRVERDANGLPVLSQDVLQNPSALEEAARITAEVMNANLGRNANVVNQANAITTRIAAAQNTLATLNLESNRTFFEQGAAADSARQIARAQLQKLQQLLETYESGKFNDVKASLAASLHSLFGLSPDAVSSATTSAEKFEQFIKATYTNVFNQLKTIPGQAKATEIEGLLQASPGPGLQPEANRQIVSSMLGIINHDSDKFRAAINKRDSLSGGLGAFNQAGFQREWSADPQHDPTRYIREAYASTPVRGATPSTIGGFKEGHQYIIEPGQFGFRGTSPTKVIYLGIDQNTMEPRFRLVGQ